MSDVQFASDPLVVKCPALSDGNPARRATARMTWASISTATGDVVEVASCGLNVAAMRSAHCEGNVGGGLNSPK